MAGYSPQPDQIDEKAYPGSFYLRSASKGAITVAEIARVAASRSGTPISTANMVVRIVNSPWNRMNFIPYSEGPYQHYKSYGLAGGPQYRKVGGAFPVLWIPTADGKEPEQVFGALPYTPPTFSFNPPGESTTKPFPGLVVNPPGGDGMPETGGDEPYTPPGEQPSSRKWWIIGGIAAAVALGGAAYLATRKKKGGKGK